MLFNGTVTVTEINGTNYVFLEDFEKQFGDSLKQSEKLVKIKAENEKLREEKLAVEQQVAELEKQNADLQDSHMKLYNDSKDEIRELKEEIQRLGGEHGHSEFDRISQLEDRHQQDCIRINDLTTTISVLSSLYTNLRKNAGMD